MKIILYSILLTVFIVPAFGKELILSGSTTIQPVLERIAKIYMQQNPDMKISVRGGGSARGIQHLITKQTDIVMSSRFILSSELSTSFKNNVYPVPFHFAYDAIIPIINVRNPLYSLSSEQLSSIYTGKISHWSQLGGTGGKITVVCRDAFSGTHDVWNGVLLKNIPAPVSACDHTSSSNLDVVHAVRDNSNAIGYVSLSYLSANARIKPLKVDNIMGSYNCVKQSCYVISRSLFLFTDGWPETEKLNFIKFILHPEKGQKIIHKSGLIPLY